ncbi:MAG: glycoside hydrolase family 38, partial [Planctomycetes bacterium]|nr:glycoside hydrolase family 38 [Planctomycetota bacterium]
DPAEVGDDALLLHGVLSSRMYLKQANARCENELGRWAEPFAALAAGLGEPYPHQFLHLAWRYLITNHAHDSMCGCSLDAVHDDMMGRFRHSLQISRHVAGDALRQIAARVQRPPMEGKDFLILVFNPGSDDLVHPVDVTIRFPAAIDTLFAEGFNYEPKVSFRLYDQAGQEVPYELVNQRWRRRGLRRPLRKFPGPDDRHEVDVTVPLAVPAHGYASLLCRPVAAGQPTRHPGTMRADHRSIENEYLRLSVQPNGTVSLLDKRTGQLYEELLTFEDRADIGDGWYHGQPVNDEAFLSTACTADVALVADGFAKATIRIAREFHVPRCFCFDRMVRSDETEPLRITSFVTLRQGCDFVEVRTVVRNTIRDHRLRVLLPTGTHASTYFADSAFDVVERPIALRPDNADYREMETETKPQYTWTAVQGVALLPGGDPADLGGRASCPPASSQATSEAGRMPAPRGLAVVSTGLPESAVCDLPNRPIALTLFRSFIKAFLTDGNEGGELQGTHEFAYLLVPLSAELPRTRLCRLGQALAAPPRSVQVEGDMLTHHPAPELPPTRSFLRLEPGRAVVTAVHRGRDRDALIVRMFNPTDEAVVETLICPGPVRAAQRVDLEGNVLAVASVSGDRVTTSLAARQIVTLAIA